MGFAWGWPPPWAQWVPQVPLVVRWLAWARPAPWVDPVARKWVDLLALWGQWVQAQVALNLALADRQQVVLLAPLRRHVDQQHGERLWVVQISNGSIS